MTQNQFRGQERPRSSTQRLPSHSSAGIVLDVPPDWRSAVVHSQILDSGKHRSSCYCPDFKTRNTCLDIWIASVVYVSVEEEGVELRSDFVLQADSYGEFFGDERFNIGIERCSVVTGAWKSTSAGRRVFERPKELVVIIEGASKSGQVCIIGRIRAAKVS
jgi:hypothetical protein